MTLTVPKVHRQNTLELRDKNQVAISTLKSAIFLLRDNQKLSLLMKRLSSEPELITSSFASRLQSKELSDEHLANWPSKEFGTFARFYSTDENCRHVWKYSQGRVYIRTTKHSFSALPFRPIELLLEIRWPAHTNVGHIWQMSLKKRFETWDGCREGGNAKYADKNSIGPLKGSFKFWEA